MNQKAVFAVLLFSALLCGCGAKDIAGDLSDKTVNTAEGLVLSIDSVTVSGAEYTVTNNTDTPARCGTGADCLLEVKRDDEWYELRQTVDSPMTMELYHCTREEPLKQSVDWSTRYGELPAGRYRLLKSAWFDDSVWLAAEFSVK